MSLFEAAETQNLRNAQPLAARMRPATLDEFVGQQHFLGEGKLLRRLLAADRLGSVIFYGPPGTGKTTLANLLAAASRSQFCQVSAVASGVKEIRQLLDEARDRLAAAGKRTLLFIDEIHRFNRAQQDVLLPDVEEGVVILVGATTQNPFFAINSALVSRSRVFEFKPLSVEEIKTLVRRALADRERGLGKEDVRLDDDALEFLAQVSDGDARRALSALEVGVLSSAERPLQFTRALDRRVGAAQSGRLRQTGRCPLRFGQRPDQEHPRQRSGRGPLLARPDAGRGRGCAIPFPANRDSRQRRRGQRRSAGPAVGGRSDAGLRIRRAARMSAHAGPGCHLSRLRPKSNAATIGIGEALADVHGGRLLPVPIHLREKHYPGAKRLGHGAGYEYAHNAVDAVAAQDYLGVEREYYRPVNRGFEQELAKRLETIRAKLREAREKAAD